jgi:hypothetical protein
MKSQDNRPVDSVAVRRLNRPVLPKKNEMKNFTLFLFLITNKKVPLFFIPLLLFLRKSRFLISSAVLLKSKNEGASELMKKGFWSYFLGERFLELFFGKKVFGLYFWKKVFGVYFGKKVFCCFF